MEGEGEEEMKREGLTVEGLGVLATVTEGWVPRPSNSRLQMFEMNSGAI